MVLTNFEFDNLLDLAPWQGQRQCTYSFFLSDQNGTNLGQIYPLRSAQLSHDTTRTIKRQLNFDLGAADTALVNPISDRVDLFMDFPNGTSYPMGKYLFTDAQYNQQASGESLGTFILSDFGYIVDQPIDAGISAHASPDSTLVDGMIQQVMTEVDVSYTLEGSAFSTSASWAIGTSRGNILEALALSGDYFSPWFDNNNIYRFIKAFDPATQVPDFDFDAGNAVIRDTPVITNGLLTAPNRFIVSSNNSIDSSVAVYAIADVPQSAPHSIQNRGFVVANIQNIGVGNVAQATAMAQNLAIRQTVFEQTRLAIAPDPRHDSYNVSHWQGDLWLELSWSLTLTPGAPMNILMRKAYMT